MSTFTQTLADRLVAGGQKAIDKFKAALDTNPAYAFEWSQSAFEGAAEFKVGSILKELTMTTGIDEDLEYIHDQMLNSNRYAKRSSSVQSNEIEREVAIVWTKVYEQILRHVEDNRS